MFKEQPRGISDQSAAQQAVEQTNVVLTSLDIPKDSLIHQYKWASHGFVGHLTSGQVEKLRKDPRIDHVVKDYYYKAIQTGRIESIGSFSNKSNMVATTQTTPWGVNRVGGPLDGTGKTAWILDSGIDLDHPDLNVDFNRSASFVANESADDNLGHGTYVAGILAAKANSQDAVGVAAGATVVAVKVCGQDGGCFVGDVKAGVEYAAGNFSSGDVVNMSLGFPSYATGISDLENSIINAANSGLKFTIAAGNEKQNANNVSPARVEHSNVWTVSAFRQGDAFSVIFDYDHCGNDNAGSNYGNPPIEYSEPGERIRSLLIGGGVGMGFDGPCTASGTSYAAPHLAGLLLVKGSVDLDGTVSNDPDGDPDPIAIDEEPLQVSVDGPSIVNSGDIAMFTSSVSHQEGSVSYQWYYRTYPEQSWILDSGATASTYSHTFYNSGGYENQAVKLEVNSAGETASDIQSVYVQPCTRTATTSGGTISPDNPQPCN